MENSFKHVWELELHAVQFPLVSFLLQFCTRYCTTTVETPESDIDPPRWFNRRLDVTYIFSEAIVVRRTIPFSDPTSLSILVGTST